MHEGAIGDIMRNESDIERKFGAELDKWGACWEVDLDYIKFVAPGRMGFPDRLVIWGPRGGMLFIEWKRPGHAPRPMQKYILNRIRKLGIDVRVYDDWRIAMAEVTSLIGAQTGADPWHENDSKLAGSKVVLASGQRQNSDCTKVLFSPEEFRLGRCLTCSRPIACHHD